GLCFFYYLAKMKSGHGLEGLGKISHEVAVALVEKEYEVFRTTQDKLHKSDFDKFLEASSIVKTKIEEA
ncbi:MAG TPA: hypothetical protein PLY23_08175, partial [Alphaproteobacteria bacterium]|nr:hypothetical protein [Alphaproteobacteria bacterium]HQS94638.1 hypothetical protein [Alphaproteobacteria bacterium]